MPIQNQPEIRPATTEVQSHTVPKPEQIVPVTPEADQLAPGAGAEQTLPREDLDPARPNLTGISEQDAQSIVKREQAIEAAEKVGKIDPVAVYGKLKSCSNPSMLVDIRKKMAAEIENDIKEVA